MRILGSSFKGITKDDVVKEADVKLPRIVWSSGRSGRGLLLATGQQSLEVRRLLLGGDDVDLDLLEPRRFEPAMQVASANPSQRSP